MLTAVYFFTAENKRAQSFRRDILSLSKDSAKTHVSLVLCGECSFTYHKLLFSMANSREVACSSRCTL